MSSSLSCREGRMQQLFNALTLCGCLTFCTAFLFVLVFHPDVLYTETSIDCLYPAPDVNLPEMHVEIRNLLLSQFFNDSAPGCILMNGGFVTYRYDTDVEQPFRQESNFLYLTGYSQPNATVIIDIATNKTIVFIPDQGQDYAIWNGNIENPQEIAANYMFDDVFYREEIEVVLQDLSGGDPDYTVYILNSLVEFPGKSDYQLDTSYLETAVYTRRSLKTNAELDLMRYASNVSSEAHMVVMRYAQPGLYEYNVEGRFLDGCFACGLTIQAYLPICASGNNSAILHYNANDRLMEDGDFLLIDAGAEYNGYASDITRTYPVNGVFSEEQSTVYNMCLNVQGKVINQLYAGMSWAELNLLTKTLVCEELIYNQFVIGSTDDCLSHFVYYLFFPHGVSHYLGLDVHDRSAIGNGALQASNVITVEPGIYFNEALIAPAFTDPQYAPYLNQSRIQPFLDNAVGGVRIEDDVIIFSDHVEVISLLPKTISAIERWMSGVDERPEYL